MIDKALEQIAEFNLLKENGIIICEFSNHEQINTNGFKVIKQYHYGLTDTLLLEKESKMAKTKAVIPGSFDPIHMDTLILSSVVQGALMNCIFVC